MRTPWRLHLIQHIACTKPVLDAPVQKRANVPEALMLRAFGNGGGSDIGADLRRCEALQRLPSAYLTYEPTDDTVVASERVLGPTSTPFRGNELLQCLIDWNWFVLVMLVRILGPWIELAQTI